MRFLMCNAISMDNMKNEAMKYDDISKKQKASEKTWVANTSEEVDINAQVKYTEKNGVYTILNMDTVDPKQFIAFLTEYANENGTIKFAYTTQSGENKNVSATITADKTNVAKEYDEATKAQESEKQAQTDYDNKKIDDAALKTAKELAKKETDDIKKANDTMYANATATFEEKSGTDLLVDKVASPRHPKKEPEEKLATQNAIKLLKEKGVTEFHTLKGKYGTWVGFKLGDKYYLIGHSGKIYEADTHNNPKRSWYSKDVTNDIFSKAQDAVKRSELIEEPKVEKAESKSTTTIEQTNGSDKIIDDKTQNSPGDQTAKAAINDDPIDKNEADAIAHKPKDVKGLKLADKPTSIKANGKTYLGFKVEERALKTPLQDQIGSNYGLFTDKSDLTGDLYVYYKGAPGTSIAAN